MPEAAEGSTERFCWVKAVMQAPPCHATDEESLEACKSPQTLQCVNEPGSMPPPPSPALAADASHLPNNIPLILGGGTPPPSGQSIPKTLMEQGAAQGAAMVASGGYWQVAAFSPGAAMDWDAPIVSMVFMPVRGTRYQAMAWRLLNPEWFRDAVAVTLLNHTS